MCSDSQLLWYLQGFAFTLALGAIIIAGAAFASAKRSRLLIRRGVDEIHRQMGTRKVEK